VISYGALPARALPRPCRARSPGKEHLAGFWIITAADLDAALEWAKLAAAAEQRPIEVRPLFGGDLDDAIRLG
jgi:hypothetical protein